MQMRVGAYELLRPLGVGGMAETFLAVRNRSVGPAQRVCLKRILVGYASDPSFLELFADEAQLLAHMHHDSIVQIYDFGEADGTLYMALELVEGVDLERMQGALVHRKERLQPAVALFLVSKLLSALDYAHTLRVQGQPLNVVHRDISPSNILISRRGEVKLTDFGIAKARGRKHRTQSGFTKGKLAYMSPEQVRAHELDARSDLFAVGVVLHELLTGVHPFDAPTEVELLGKILAGDRPPMRSLLRRAPARLVASIDALLEVDPANRPESAREALRMLPPCDRPIDCQQALAGLVRQLEPPGLFEQAAQAAAVGRADNRHAVPRMFSERAPRSAVHEAPTRAYQIEGPLAHEAPTRADIRAADVLSEEARALHADAGSRLNAHEARPSDPSATHATQGDPSSGYYPTARSAEGLPVENHAAIGGAAGLPPPLPASRPEPPAPPRAAMGMRSGQPAPAAVASRGSRRPGSPANRAALEPTERLRVAVSGPVSRSARARGGAFALSDPRARPGALTSRLVYTLFVHRRALVVALTFAALVLTAWLYPEPFLRAADALPQLAAPIVGEDAETAPAPPPAQAGSAAVRPTVHRPIDAREPNKAEARGSAREPNKVEARGSVREPNRAEARGFVREPDKAEARGLGPEQTKLDTRSVVREQTKLDVRGSARAQSKVEANVAVASRARSEREQSKIAPPSKTPMKGGNTAASAKGASNPSGLAGPKAAAIAKRAEAKEVASPKGAANAKIPRIVKGPAITKPAAGAKSTPAKGVAPARAAANVKSASHAPGGKGSASGNASADAKPASGAKPLTRSKP